MSNLKSKDNCSGQYPGLWRIHYAYKVPIRDACENTGRYETIEADFDVVALTAGIAQETFVMKYAPERYTRLTNPERICYVDAIMLMKAYGGHFS